MGTTLLGSLPGVASNENGDSATARPAVNAKMSMRPTCGIRRVNGRFPDEVICFLGALVHRAHLYGEEDAESSRRGPRRTDGSKPSRDQGTPGELVGDILAELGVSLDEAAEALGISSRDLGDVITGRTAISVKWPY